jgi:hypothetical protein
MAWHVNNADLLTVWEVEPPKPEFDCHFAGLFFFEAIGMRACKSRYECGFAVIYMTGCTYYAHKGLEGLLRRS